MTKFLKILKTAFIAAPFSLLCPSIKASENLKAGDIAPTATLSDESGKSLNLEETFKQGTTLLFFYPKANTGG